MRREPFPTHRRRSPTHRERPPMYRRQPRMVRERFPTHRQRLPIHRERPRMCRRWLRMYRERFPTHRRRPPTRPERSRTCRRRFRMDRERPPTGRGQPPTGWRAVRIDSPAAMPEIPYPLRAPELGPGVWIQEPEVSIVASRGRVVLVDFWESTCVNCLRTLPYLIAWHERYAARGLAIVGVHTPEFAFTAQSEH